MKVTTDGCLFGAMLPYLPDLGKGFKVLDIGTGTGLLSLMFAQKNPEAAITAVELDPGSAAEAARNFEAAPLGKLIETISADILSYQNKQPFDLIFSNPPFYENQLAAPAAEKNRAHHDETLTLNGLVQSIDRLLTPEGVAWILLPAYREEVLIKIMSTYKFQVYSLCEIKPHPAKNPFRMVVELGRQNRQTHFKSMTIKTDQQKYSPEFIDLLQPYYLFL